MRPNISNERITGGQVRVGNFYSVAVSELEKAFGLVDLKGLVW